MRLRNDYFFMRHAEAVNNRRGILSTSTTRYPLTPSGRQRALEAAKSLRGVGITRIYSSPVRRARETAGIIRAVLSVPLVVEKGLSEIKIGPQFEDQPIQKFWAYFKRSIQLRFVLPPPGGESSLMTRRRLIKTLRKIDRQNRGEKILIVSHADPLWLLESALLGLSIAGAIEHRRRRYYSLGEIREVIKSAASWRFRRWSWHKIKP